MGALAKKEKPVISQDQIVQALRGDRKLFNTLLGHAAVVTLFAKAIDANFSQKLDYYFDLIVFFSKKHPVMSIALAASIANLLDDQQKTSGLIEGIVAGAVIVAINSSRREHLLGRCKNEISSFFKNYDRIKFKATHAKKGHVFTNNRKSFFEIEFKFGDSPTSIIEFELRDDLSRKVIKSHPFDVRDKHANKFNLVCDFMNSNKLFDVTKAFP